MARDIERRIKRLENGTTEDEVVEVSLPPGWCPAGRVNTWGKPARGSAHSGNVERRVWVIGKGYVTADSD
jgi:hypothetical protein